MKSLGGLAWLLSALGASPLTGQSHVTPTALPSWGRDSTHAPLAWAAGYTGQGVVIGVLDAGINPTVRADLGARLVGERNVVQFEDGIPYPGENVNDASDRGGCTNHGSGTTSQAASGAYGVAPGADVLAIRIAAPVNGACVSGTVALRLGVQWATQWAIANHRHVILSISYEFGTYHETWSTLALADARAAGVLVVVAAGNNGDAVLHYPANDTTTISVGAMDANGSVPGFSNRGVDLVAPGVNVSSYSDNTVGSGTSRATPYVAGSAALVWGANPSLTLDDVAGALLCTTIPLSATLPDPASGWGRLDAATAVASVVGGAFVASGPRTYTVPTRDSVRVVSAVPLTLAPNRSAAVLRNGWLVYTATVSDTVRLITP